MSIDPACFDKRLLYVTGKGGVGRTTVTTALGVAAAARGRRTLICEVSDQDRVSTAFAAADEQRGAAPGELAESLWATSVDTGEALEEWLGRQLGSAALVRTLTRSQAFQYFVAAAPGARELITIGKVYDLVEGSGDGTGPYDLVIVDAPASGHGIAMLETPATFGQIARVGTVRRQAEKIRALLTDPERTGYLAVTLPEETPVNETLEVETAVSSAVGTELDAIIVNAVRAQPLALEEARAVRSVHDAEPPGPTRSALAAALRAHDRARDQHAQVDRLRSRGRAPVLTLPFLEDPESGDGRGRLSRALSAAP